MIKKFLTASAFLFGFVLFEASILSNIHYLKIIPDLVLICSVYLSLNNGKLFGTGAGFAGGLFLDFISISPFGLNCFVRTIIGYIFGLFRKTVNTSGFIVPLIIGVCITVIKGIVLLIVSILFPNVKTFSFFSMAFLLEIAFNAILTPVIFKFLNFFKKVITIEIEKVV